MDDPLSLDLCPYPQTDAPNGWRARREGKPNQPGLVEYHRRIYWMEGWSACDKRIAASGLNIPIATGAYHG